LVVEVGELNEAAVKLYEKIGLTKIIDGRILMSKKIEKV
jgi:ribosomal protein S18 acetylase RimI-like enzyme